MTTFPSEADITAPGRLEFPNGYAIDIDSRDDEWVYYRLWPPGVETQGMFDRTYRKPPAEFGRLALEAGAVRVR